MVEPTKLSTTVPRRSISQPIHQNDPSRPKFLPIRSHYDIVSCEALDNPLEDGRPHGRNSSPTVTFKMDKDFLERLSRLPETNLLASPPIDSGSNIGPTSPITDRPGYIEAKYFHSSVESDLWKKHVPQRDSGVSKSVDKRDHTLGLIPNWFCTRTKWKIPERFRKGGYRFFKKALGTTSQPGTQTRRDSDPSVGGTKTPLKASVGRYGTYQAPRVSKITAQEKFTNWYFIKPHERTNSTSLRASQKPKTPPYTKLRDTKRPPVCGTSSPLYKPFPLEGPMAFVSSPNSTGEAGSLPRRQYSMRSTASTAQSDSSAMYSELGLDPLDMDQAIFSESDSAYLPSDMSPESRMLRKPRLLVPGYNLSLTSSVASEDSSRGNYCSKDDSYIDGSGCSQKNDFFRSLEYLAIDTGNEADIESQSSACSSRVFEDRQHHHHLYDYWPPTPGTGSMSDNHYLMTMFYGYITSPQGTIPALSASTDTECGNLAPSSSGLSSGGDVSNRGSWRRAPEREFFDQTSLENLRQVTTDIQKSFGKVRLRSFSDAFCDSDGK